MARYEVCVNGSLSERAKGAFCPLDARAAQPQTILVGEFPEQSDLHAVLAQCSDMGLVVLSLRRLPADG